MKKIIIGLIIGSLISSISVYAYVANAKDITYEPSNNNFAVTKVNTALDTLYERGNNINDFMDGTFNRKIYSGHVANHTETLSFTKGTYLLYIIYQQSWPGSTQENYDQDFDNLMNVSLDTNGVTCENYNNACDRRTATEIHVSNYAHLLHCFLIKKCKVPNSGSVSLVFDSHGDANAINNRAHTIVMESVKID